MKDFILISPWSKQLRDKSCNPKNYPWWPEVIRRLKMDYDIVQIGVQGEEKLTEDFRVNLPLVDVKVLIQECYVWISVDNFLPHLAHLIEKSGIVIWGISDPLVFGYSNNINLLKSRKNLRENQFYIWEGIKYNPSVFVSPDAVLSAVENYSLNTR